MGTPRNGGTRLFGISGHVERPGVYELPMGYNLKKMIYEVAGGIRGGRELKAVVPGGSSTPVLLPEEIDIGMDFDQVGKAGSMLGSGGVVVIDDQTCIVEFALRTISFYQHESCGWCIPCREGTDWLKKSLTRFHAGFGEAKDIDNIQYLAENMLGRTFCPLGDAAAMPTLGFVKKFRKEFEESFERQALPVRQACGSGCGLGALETNGRRNLHSRWKEADRSRGDAADRRLPQGGHRDSCLLLLPRPQPAGRLPHVRRAPGKSAQAANRLHHAPSPRARSSSPSRRRSRRRARPRIELLLGNHPLDCPVCDAGGECELQDMTFKYGAAESLYAEAKHHREEQQWSPAVYFDRPRCILCYRCVRMCGEGMDVWALGVENRGSSSIIVPNVPAQLTPDSLPHLDCEQCGMCIDVCPVGALTSGSYRYKTRPWEMNHVATVCTHCGDGCKVTLGVRSTSRRIARLCAATTATSAASTATFSATRAVSHSTLPTAASASRSRWCASPTAS